MTLYKIKSERKKLINQAVEKRDNKSLWKNLNKITKGPKDNIPELTVSKGAGDKIKANVFVRHFANLVNDNRCIFSKKIEGIFCQDVKLCSR